MVKEVQYRLIKKLDKVEIRLYEKLIIAEVDGYGDGGFNLLFDYISGNNTTKTNLEMTAPVISKSIEMTTPVLSEKESIAFVMPEEYTLENTPEPNDERIKIKQIPERYVAALKFSPQIQTQTCTRAHTPIHIPTYSLPYPHFHPLSHTDMARAPFFVKLQC